MSNQSQGHFGFICSEGSSRPWKGWVPFSQFATAWRSWIFSHVGSSLIFVENCHNLLVGQGGGGVRVQGGHLQLSPDGGVQHRDVVRAVRDEHPVLGKLLEAMAMFMS